MTLWNRSVIGRTLVRREYLFIHPPRRRRTPVVLLGVLLSTLFFFGFEAQAGTAQAQGVYGLWQAYSRTAMAITGDVNLSPQALRLANHEPTPIHVLMQAPDASFAIFELRAQPSALNGNTICGRYVIAARDEKAGQPTLTLSVFEDVDKAMQGGEKLVAAPGFCATYHYFR